MELSVLDISGKDTGRKIVLDEATFDIKPNEHAVYLEVKRFLAAKRQGTHKSKERSELSGSTRKLHKQKGTGGSRKGDINNPLFRGGARVFGPKPRDYSFKLNKNLRKLARRSVIADKISNNNLLIIEDFKFDLPKTKKLKEILTNFNLSDRKTLFVSTIADKCLYLSSRNLSKTKFLNLSELNTYDILNANSVLLFESSVQELQKQLTK